MSEQTETPRKQYMIGAGLVHTIIMMIAGAIVTLVIFMISPEFLAPAKSIFADRGAGIFVGGSWFLLGWIYRGMAE